MYENLNYIEIRALPNDKKKEALMELQSRLGDNRSIANKLGVSTIAITNMIRKYVLGEHVGRLKNEDAKNDAKDDIKDDIKDIAKDIAAEDIIAAAPIEDKHKNKLKDKLKDKPKDKLRKKRAKKIRAIAAEIPETIQDESIESDSIKQILTAENQSLFIVSISKTLLGESIQSVLKGIGNALIKNQVYKLEITIKE